MDVASSLSGQGEFAGLEAPVVEGGPAKRGEPHELVARGPGEPEAISGAKPKRGTSRNRKKNLIEIKEEGQSPAGTVPSGGGKPVQPAMCSIRIFTPIAIRMSPPRSSARRPTMRPTTGPSLAPTMVRTKLVAPMTTAG